MKQTTMAAIIAFFALLASPIVASASVAVYSYRGSTTTTGGGKSLSTTNTGTMVIDLDTMEATYVGQFSTGSGKTLKNFWLSAPLSSTINTQVLGPKGATSTVMAIAENPGSRYTGSVVHFESAVGLNSRLTIRNKGATEIAILPRTLASPGFVITEDSSNDYVAQSTGAYTFNSASTLAHNNNQKTFSAVITDLENAYKAKKFTQWTASNLVGVPTPTPVPTPAPTPTPTPQSQVTVTTLAGLGILGSTDGGGATAKFNWPMGLATDSNGYIYVADSSNQKIRKISSIGQVSTLAGSGTARLSGFRNGIGASADFYYPSGVAVDRNNNMYISDYNRIRKITQSGEVTLINASYGIECSGVAVDLNSNIYVLNVSESKIYKIASTGSVSIFAGSGSIGSNDGIGTDASFYYPRGVAVDKNGNVYVADSGNMKIRKISPYGGVTTLAGSGLKGSNDGIGTDASFKELWAINVDSSGNVYVGDAFKIRKITPSGQVTTLAGTGIEGSSDGTGNTATFSHIQGIALDILGNVYVSDTGNNKIRKITIPQ